MASFEPIGFDDGEIPIPLTGTADCPECGKSFDFSLDNNSPVIICPHCQAEIRIELP